MTYALLAGVVLFLVVSTARFKLHPFLALLMSALMLGVGSGVAIEQVLEALMSGFGATLRSIGLVIVAGTIIGVVLEASGAAEVMAQTVVSIFGPHRAPAAMGATGAVVSIPVFCDSGFVLLSPLRRAVASATGQGQVALTLMLSMGLYTTHVFVPPTPGPVAAASEVGADVGAVMLWGAVVAVPVLVAVHVYAQWIDGRVSLGTQPDENAPKKIVRPSGGESLRAFAPVFVPVVLIAGRTIFQHLFAHTEAPSWAQVLITLGHPVLALFVGVAVAFATSGSSKLEDMAAWTERALRSSGTILIITGAGGALGGVLKATAMADEIANTLANLSLGGGAAFVPFILAAALKTTLGSSTVAIITTAPIVAPLAGALGYEGSNGSALLVLCVGAGAMTVSHANDSYFWVVSQFSGLSVKDAYRVHTVGSLVAGITGACVVAVLNAFV